jgi:hypothetical protein
LFQDHEIFFAPALPLADVLTQWTGDAFAGFSGFIAQQGWLKP